MSPRILFLIWQAGALAAFVFLTFMDGYRYIGWNWMIAIPDNFFPNEIWPIHWLILRWVA